MRAGRGAEPSRQVHPAQPQLLCVRDGVAPQRHRHHAARQHIGGGRTLVGVGIEGNGVPADDDVAEGVRVLLVRALVDDGDRCDDAADQAVDDEEDGVTVGVEGAALRARPGVVEVVEGAAGVPDEREDREEGVQEPAAGLVAGSERAGELRRDRHRLQDEEQLGPAATDVGAAQQVEQAVDEGVAASGPVGALPRLDLVDDGPDQQGEVAGGLDVCLQVGVDGVTVGLDGGQRRLRQFELPRCRVWGCAEVEQHGLAHLRASEQVGDEADEVHHLAREPAEHGGGAHGCGSGMGTFERTGTRSASGALSVTGPSCARCTMYGPSTGSWVSGSIAEV